MVARRTLVAFLLALSLGAGCGGGELSGADASDDGATPDVAMDGSPPGDAGPFDAGMEDAGAADAGPGDAGPPPPLGPILYPMGRRHSPIPADVAAHLEAVAAATPAARGDVFSKVGDSITAYPPYFLGCFAGASADLGGRDDLADTHAAFLAGDAGGTTPYQRTSEAATSGWSASAALSGSPAPIDRELTAVSPRYATLMFGTNDIGFRQLDTYAEDMLTLVDRMLAAGAIPLMSTIPPRDDQADVGARVPTWNLTIRAIAQGRRVPLVDFHDALVALPGHGLSGDGVHPTAYGGGTCVLTPTGLGYGYNVRNLITLEQLDRARRVVAGEGALDADAPRLAGAGTAADPFVVASLPFAHLGDTRESTERRVDFYTGCAPDSDESGPEQVYAVHLDAPARLTATVVSRAGVDIDVHLLDATGTAEGCLARDHRTVTRDLAAGDYVVVADSFVSGGAELAGEYALLLVAE